MTTKPASMPGLNLNDYPVIYVPALEPEPSPPAVPDPAPVEPPAVLDAAPVPSLRWQQVLDTVLPILVEALPNILQSLNVPRRPESGATRNDTGLPPLLSAHPGNPLVTRGWDYPGQVQLTAAPTQTRPQLSPSPAAGGPADFKVELVSRDRVAALLDKGLALSSMLGPDCTLADLEKLAGEHRETVIDEIYAELNDGQEPEDHQPGESARSDIRDEGPGEDLPGDGLIEPG